MSRSRTCSGTDQGREKFEYERTTAIGDNEDQATDFAIRIIGFLGLASVVLSLWSATVRPAGTRLSFDTGITPLIAVELARSKADLEQFFGEPGSANRKLMAGRSPLPGLNFVTSWMIFLFGLLQLMPKLRPRMREARFWIFLLLFFTSYYESHSLRRMAEAANASSVTDAMFATIRETCLTKWTALFADTMLCSLIFYRTPMMLQAGGAILWVSSALGLVATTFPNYQWLAGPAVLGLFAGVCGITVLFLLRPELFYADTHG